MAHLALKGYVLSAAAGGKSDKIRFNWLNGFVAQRLLFARGLERKPVSQFWFRLIWPLVWQKRLLMPLVEAKGIYCFYSKPLIEALAQLIGGRECLEIAAGDGTLSRFLAAEGVRATATDDYSWKHAVSYPETVLKMDAAQALRKFKPTVVICSWPPRQQQLRAFDIHQSGGRAVHRDRQSTHLRVRKLGRLSRSNQLRT